MNWCKIFEIGLMPIVSFIIMCITLFVQKMLNKLSLKEQRMEFKKSFEAQEKHYLENQKIIKEQHRLSIMPYLIMEDIKIKNRDDNTVFYITLKNIGNNIATNISVNLLKESPSIQIYKFGKAKKEYAYSDFLFDNILQVNSSGSFGVTFICDPNGIATDCKSTFKNVGELEFTVTFYDIQLDKYTQSFFFQYNVANSAYPIGRQETYPPTLEIITE